MIQNSTNLAARSPPTGTRASGAAYNTTAEPPLASGFGTLIDKEHALRVSLAKSDGRVGGDHAADVDRILLHQQKQMDANIALLEQRYEGIFTGQPVVASDESRSPARSGAAPYGEGDMLRDLCGQHASLLVDIDALLERAPDGKRGELILGEVKRNHEEMAWILTALLREDATAGKAAEENSPRVVGAMSRAQENWDNEGGPTRAATIDR